MNAKIGFYITLQDSMEFIYETIEFEISNRESFIMLSTSHLSKQKNMIHF